LNAAVIVIDIVAIGGGGRGNIAITIAAAIAVAIAVAVAVSPIAVVTVIVDIASSLSLLLLCSLAANRRSWTKPRHRYIAHGLRMAPLPWIGRAEASGVDTRTLPSCCCPVGNIMVFERWKLEVRYPMVDGTYSYDKLRERKMRNCAGTFLS
jgi:hypothetical protein